MSSRRVLQCIAPVVLLKKPVQQFKPRLFADRPPDPDLRRMMPALEIEIVPPVGPHDSFINRNVNVTKFLDCGFVIVRIVDPIISLGKAPTSREHQSLSRGIELIPEGFHLSSCSRSRQR